MVKLKVGRNILDIDKNDLILDIGIGCDWTPKFCKECGKPLTRGNQYIE